MDQYPFDDENGIHLEMHLPGFPESQELLCSEALDCNLCPTAKGVSYAGLSSLDADAAGDALEAELNVFSLYLAKDCGSGQLQGSDWQPWQQGECAALRVLASFQGSLAGGSGWGYLGAACGRGAEGSFSEKCVIAKVNKAAVAFSLLSEPELPALAGPEEAGGGGSGSAGSGEPPLGSQSSPLGCSRCGKVFGSASALSKHCLSHSQERLHVCAVCSKAFKRPDHLSGHMLTHQKKTPFICPEPDCEKSYCNPHSLRRHYGLRHSCREAPAGEEPSLLPAPGSQGGGKSAEGRLPCSESGPFPPESDLLRDIVSQNCPVGAFPSAEHADAASPGPSRASRLTSDGSGLAEDDFSRDCSSCQRDAASSSVTNPTEVPVVAPWENMAIDLTTVSFISEPAGLQPCPDSTLPCFPAPRKPENRSSDNFECMRNVPVCAKSERNSVCLACEPPAAADERPDASPVPAAPLKAKEDALSEPALGCFEEIFQSAEPHASCPLENAEEPSFPEVSKRDEGGQLFPKPPEPAACPGPLQMPQQHLFQAIADSPLAPSPPAAPGAACLAANLLRQPRPAFASQRPQPTGYQGLSTHLRQAVPCSHQPENELSTLKKEKSNDGSAETARKAPARTGWSWRPPASRREKLAAPSQVAMASFPAAPVPRRLTIFNRIQGGNIYTLTHAAEGARSPAGRDSTGAAPVDGSGCESDVLCRSCLRPRSTGKGLESHGRFGGERWHSAQGKEEQQVCHAGGASHLWLPAAGDGNQPSKPWMPSGNVPVAPLVIPVSVPVSATSSPAGNEVSGKDGVDGKDPGANLHHQMKLLRPKSLFIPPPAAPRRPAGAGRCYRSTLRSPTILVDHLLRDLLQRSPYTPPPMLSPLREGSGLYFSTLCSSSARGDPGRLLSTVLGGASGDLGLCLMNETTKVSVQPHINIGSQFQAEIPELRCGSSLEEDGEAGLLVWKPWGDIATNPATQDRVTELLHVACSSAVPGGGMNLELALHCLHEAQSNVLEALEMLLFGVPQKSGSHPLADYHYTGSAAWSSLEKDLFEEALAAHGKDFHLIQKKVVWNPQRLCLLWKEDGKMKRKREKKMPRDAGSTSHRRDEAQCQAGSADNQSMFPCSLCGRVFEKIKGRNAHMKKHRPQVKPPEDEMVPEASGSGVEAGQDPKAAGCFCY
ncbi:LOW QUALITY PROTEIN: zinc finger protein 541 [Falco peregrinus]|uniref:LOW QUALITY PROTEIN: zinc finger protein 541 n=1 Tax=Falco peregrinus TaxID=8954 RepID=UPI002478C88E|nr:LOW QUALITY PROTEIN: zinc finger protein 541 [Falco peregrinus]